MRPPSGGRNSCLIRRPLRIRRWARLAARRVESRCAAGRPSGHRHRLTRGGRVGAARGLALETSRRCTAAAYRCPHRASGSLNAPDPAALTVACCDGWLTGRPRGTRRSCSSSALTGVVITDRLSRRSRPASSFRAWPARRRTVLFLTPVSSDVSARRV